MRHVTRWSAVLCIALVPACAATSSAPSSGAAERETSATSAGASVVGSSPSGAEAAEPDSTPTPRRVATMSDLMVHVLYPASDAVFYIETRTPETDTEWGVLEGRTLLIAETANLLMMPERARDEGRWMIDAKLMLDAGEAAYRAAKRRDVAALVALNDQLYLSCVQCHRDYRPDYGRRE